MRRTCSAKRKDGQPCGGTPLRGADKCRMHLGKRTAVVKLEQAAAVQLARLNLTPVDDPLSALAGVTAEVLAWKDQIATKVNALTTLRYSTEGGEQLRAEVALWERALDRCERFLTAMAKLNIDERLAAIAEAQAQAVMDAIRIGLEAAGVDSGQRKVALAAVRQHLVA